MKGTKIYIFAWISLGILLGGCASVDSQKEWCCMKSHSGDEEGLYWVQDACDEQLVDELTKEILTNNLEKEGAIKLAMMRNQDLQSHFEEIGVAKSDLVQAGLFKNPSLGVLFRFPFSGSGTNIDADGFLAISELWQLPYRKKVAQANLEKILLKIADKVKQVKRDIAHSYEDVLFYKETLEEEQALADTWKELRDEGLLRKEWGYVTQDDIYRDEIGYRDAQLMYEQYFLKADMAKNHLAKHISLKPEEFELKINDKQQYAFEETIDIEEAVEGAFCKRLDIQAKGLKVCEKERLVKLNQRMIFKEVHTGVSYERELDGENLLGPALEIELPLFDQNQAQIARAQYELRQAKKELNALKDDVRMHISDNIKTINYLRNKIQVIGNEIIPLQEKLEAFVQEWNDLMQINRYKLLEAKRDLIARKIEYRMACRDLNYALIELEYNKGFY